MTSLQVAGLQLTNIHLPLPPNIRIKGVGYHALQEYFIINMTVNLKIYILLTNAFDHECHLMNHIIKIQITEYSGCLQQICWVFLESKHHLTL